MGQISYFFNQINVVEDGIGEEESGRVTDDDSKSEEDIIEEGREAKEVDIAADCEVVISSGFK